MTATGAVSVTALGRRLEKCPSLRRLISAQLSVWPDHKRYLDARFLEDDEDFLQRTEQVASLVTTLIGHEVEKYCQDYAWMCSNFVEEELYFRRHHKYRHTSFAEVNAEVYARPEYMARYVNGILLSLIFWRNHARAIDIYRTHFLTNNRPDFCHLEVGPGHGLFLAFAARHRNCAHAVGWDVSDSSLAATKHALSTLNVKGVILEKRDIMETTAPRTPFDSIMINEVLEHLEDPRGALETLVRCLKPSGRIFINVPVNSPAPDHIYLWTMPEHAVRMITEAGLEVERSEFLPMTGHTLARARALKTGISVVVIARRRYGS